MAVIFAIAINITIAVNIAITITGIRRFAVNITVEAQFLVSNCWFKANITLQT